MIGPTPKSADGARHIRQGVMWAASLLITALLFWEPPMPPGAEAGIWFIILLTVVAIAWGDSRAVVLDGGRVMAPISLTAAIALSMMATLPGTEMIGMSGGFIVLVVGVGTAVGALSRWHGDQRAITMAELAMRLLITALVAGAVRLPIDSGPSLLTREFEWAEREWLLAVSLMGVAGLAVAVQTLLWSWERSAREHVRYGVALVDELRAIGPLVGGVVTSAVMVVLVARVIGPIALPIFLVPLILLAEATRRQTAVGEANTQTVRALSKLTDQGGFTPMGHAGRVALLSVSVGRELNLGEPQLRDVEYAALLHDLGQVSLARPIPGGATIHVSAVDQRRMAANGARVLARTAELSKLSSIVAQQATPYWRMEELGTLPIGSRIVRVVNGYEDLTGEFAGRAQIVKALSRLRLSVGYDYDPVVFAAMVKVLRRRGAITQEEHEELDV
ncbi:HD-GYP domain-containing protein [Ornithinimicrobium sp. INDO-MA30-4]|uniref:HD-GYP domain-containing protein n=1 Tax=Ornithinimicrobium sp. INDO-MA30-4 TaxID=2908651 RepID=UPI001F1917AD|nr:HD domain-containing phosphohydrolase [Ornithinimicrobium sp. INDO-MA30-4]UJH71519.1 hypothetical protein L0A91_07535 [Ornithinimicrobium sp. INDO-MA30-4]